MNWALGFRSLGWEVWLVEHLESRDLDLLPEGGSVQERFWDATMEEFGFVGRSTLVIDGRAPSLEAFRDFASGAQAFLNYAGHFKKLEWLPASTKKFYLDVDPAFTQLWAAVCGSDMNLEGHDEYLTVGTTFSTARVPDVGRDWVSISPPVPAESWRERCGPWEPSGQWTTVAHWYGYNDLVWEGMTYGGKRESFLSMLDLPRLLDVPCALATDLERDWGDFDQFERAGWILRSAAEVCADVPSYLRFLASSRGELGIAKSGYIVSRGGWISDRSLIYLGLGRPVVLHDTGWPQFVGPSTGLVAFKGVEDCSLRIREIEADYDACCQAAQELAATRFSPARALEPLFARL